MEDIKICAHCGGAFDFDEYDAHKVGAGWLCFDCYDNFYTYCNECAQIVKYDDCLYTDANGFVCFACVDKRRAKKARGFYFELAGGRYFIPAESLEDFRIKEA